MSLGEYLGAGASTTKLLLHLNGNANDDSGNANHCSAASGIVFSKSYGKFNEGAAFVGGHTTYLAGSNHGLGTGNINFSAGISFYVTGSRSRGELFCLGTYSITNKAIMFGVRPKSGGNDAIYFDYANSVGGSTVSRVIYNSWNHLFITKSGNTITITLNGGSPETFTKTGLNVTTALFIGFYGATGTAYFYGYIDEFLLDNRVWTPQEVTKHYTNSLGRFATI